MADVLKNLNNFKSTFPTKKIVVFEGLNPDRVRFSGITFRQKNCIFYMM